MAFFNRLLGFVTSEFAQSPARPPILESHIYSYLLLIAAVVFTQLRFRKGYEEGLSASVFLLVLLPIECRIPLPGAFPALTVHRLILVIMALNLVRNRSFRFSQVPLPAVSLCVLVGIGRILSTVGSIVFVPSLKDLLSFFLETLLFFCLVGKSLVRYETIERLLRSVVLASLCVAFIATYERYRGTNLAALLVPGLPEYFRDVTATYRHRIMLGYAMAMPLPLVLVFINRTKLKMHKRIGILAMLLLPAACYFANSRGPWAGIALGAGVLVLATGARLKKHLILMGLLVALVLIARPGVYHSIATRWEHTKSTDTLKGRSASYRLELWGLAYRQVSKSVDRFIFGYGGNSTEYMQLGLELEFGGGSNALGYTSWDSELAADFVKFGLFGLISELLLYGFILKRGLNSLRRAASTERELIGACLGTFLVFIWAMTNVAIFNPQLTFLFWTVVAIMLRIPYLTAEREAASIEPALVPSVNSGLGFPGLDGGQPNLA